MYRPIVSTTMRQQISSSIVAPRFCNLKLGSLCYVVTVAFQITEGMHQKLQFEGGYGQVKSFKYNGRYLVYWEKTFTYEVPFYRAFQEAYEAKKHLKIVMRKVKRDILADEIDNIKEWE